MWEMKLEFPRFNMMFRLYSFSYLGSISMCLFSDQCSYLSLYGEKQKDQALFWVVGECVLTT